MLKRFFLGLKGIVILFNVVLAQEIINAGEIKTILSGNLDLEMNIQVYLPESYHNSDISFPVLYVLDGQWLFLNGVAIQKTLRGENLLPEMIIVGVEMDRPERTDIFRNQWDEFISFLEEELVPFVDHTYRTKNERILFGWENSGFLASEVILNQSGIFKGAIASNGASIDEERLVSLDSLGDKRYLYLANTTKDIYTINSTLKAVETLKKVNPKNLLWTYDAFNDEVHESLAYSSIYHGLRYYYHNFGSLAFSDIEDFNDRGGLSYVREYCKARGERFGLSTEVDDDTKNTLIWMAWRQDQFEEFDLFMTEFKDVLSTDRYASAYWQNRLAQYYLKYESYDNAISFFERGIGTYPEEQFLAQMHSGLAQALLGKNEKKKAKNQLKKAIEIAKASEDSKLEEYQALLKTISK